MLVPNDPVPGDELGMEGSPADAAGEDERTAASGGDLWPCGDAPTRPRGMSSESLS